jgi:hypothetical protein
MEEIVKEYRHLSLDDFHKKLDKNRRTSDEITLHGIFNYRTVWNLDKEEKDIVGRGGDKPQARANKRTELRNQKNLLEKFTGHILDEELRKKFSETLKEIKESLEDSPRILE